MALTFKGDSTFKLQVGARGPTPDPVYHLYTRDETWQGKQTDLPAFLATRPPGSVHPLYPTLRIAEYEPMPLEAGMADLWFRYVGGAAGPPIATTKRNSLLRPSSTAIKLVRTFRRIAGGTTLNGVTTNSISQVRQEAEGEQTYSYRSPSITYYYCAPYDVKLPLFTNRAASDLAGLTPTIINKQTRQTSSEWVTVSGYSTPSDISDPDLGVTNLVQFTEFPTGGGTGTPQSRATDLVSNARGLSGWYEVEETHEIDLV